MATKPSTGKIVFLLSFMVMAFVILCYASIIQLKKSDTSRITDEVIESIHRASLSILVADVDFFGYELNNREFYKTGKSDYLIQHDSIIAIIDGLVMKATEIENMNIDVDLLRIKKIAMSYDSLFRKVRDKILIRGFEEFGQQGKMSTFAQKLETEKFLSETEFFFLRVQEKDYLLTAENGRVVQFDGLMSKLLVKYSGKRPVLQLLENYSESFHDFVKSTNEIGLETQTGLKGDLNNRTHELLGALQTLETKSDNEIDAAYHNGLTLFLFGVIGCTVLCGIFVVIIVRKL